MASSLNGIDHGRASKLLDGVLFAKDDDGDDEATAAQPLNGEAHEPAKDGDAAKQAVCEVAATPNGQQQEENKENIAPEDQDENDQTRRNCLEGKVQVRGQEKPKKKKAKSGKSKGAKKRGTGFEGKASEAMVPDRLN
jgi:hypothetical protein